MNHKLQGYYVLFGVLIGGLRGPTILVFRQRTELKFHVNSDDGANTCGSDAHVRDRTGCTKKS